MWRSRNIAAALKNKVLESSACYFQEMVFVTLEAPKDSSASKQIVLKNYLFSLFLGFSNGR